MPLNRRIQREIVGTGQAVLPLSDDICLLTVGNNRSGKSSVVRRTIEQLATVETIKVMVLTIHPSHWSTMDGVDSSIFVDQQDTDITYYQAFVEVVEVAKQVAGVRLIVVLDNADTAKGRLLTMLAVLDEMQITIIVLRKRLVPEWGDDVLVSRFDRIAIFNVYGEGTRQCIRSGLPKVDERILMKIGRIRDGEYLLV